ncbi:rhomboid family intramembrane serine protease [Cellulomonas massiliensis]|uniref:rhomboid family intramembrane serine protease n=1 Tax=Cellulomonas massiliensis TaxID=1465811 RepID=UPI0002FB2E5C|nr:rhomboid family intramembrane serine protease [Cellulomonas massiliensis]
MCPQCQVPAAVGVQCVDCVAQANAALPSTRTALGGVARRGRPVVTIGLIAACVVMYVLQLAVDGWTVRWAFNPVAGWFEPWRFVTSAFLHSQGSVLHIAMNMLALWFVGPYLEGALGRARFATLYGLSAIGGSVGVLLLAPVLEGGWEQWAVGASGAVFGLFGAVFVVLRRLGGDARGMLAVIVLNVVLGFVLPGIAWQAHLGGLVVGAALGAAYAYAPRERRALTAWVAPALVALVLVGASLATYLSAGFGSVA